MVRKVGGFTFQELNLTIDDIREIGEAGADLSYDFINRPAYHHALATADTEFLRLTLRTTLELGVDPASLVHALQNHDELTYELVHWSTGHRDDIYTYKGEEITGEDLGETVRSDLTGELTGEKAPVQPGFHDQRHRMHDRDGHRGDAGHQRPRHDRGHRPHPASASPAGDVQCAAARRIRVVGLGYVRDVDAGPVEGGANCCAAATRDGSTGPRTT